MLGMIGKNPLERLKQSADSPEKSYACAFRPTRIEQPASNSNSPSRARPQIESVGTLAGGAATVTVAVEALLARFGSRVPEATVAVLATVPDEPGLLTTRTMVAEPPTAIAPSEQLTVLVPEQDDPAGDGAAETKVVPAGRMSPTITFAAGLGPAFVTVRV
jgi:hypothetical protein